MVSLTLNWKGQICNQPVLDGDMVMDSLDNVALTWEVDIGDCVDELVFISVSSISDPAVRSKDTLK